METTNNKFVNYYVVLNSDDVDPIGSGSGIRSSGTYPVIRFTVIPKMKFFYFFLFFYFFIFLFFDLDFLVFGSTMTP